MKRNPVITHTETIAYAINYVYEQYKDFEEKAVSAEKSGNTYMANLIRENNQWRDKLNALTILYKMETGVDHEFALAEDER